MLTPRLGADRAAGGTTDATAGRLRLGAGLGQGRSLPVKIAKMGEEKSLDISATGPSSRRRLQRETSQTMRLKRTRDMKEYAQQLKGFQSPQR
jgi:hypothetical protein